jgi:1-acyl-sn-glycerol-3-phosphate acyltransferase
MFFETPLHLSRSLLSALGTKASIQYSERIPATSRILVVSNHRSFLDAPLLMMAMNRPVRFACHHYMRQVPLLRELVSALGAFPLDAPQERQKNFFQRAVYLLKSRQAVGIFPEGAQPMVQANPPNQLSPFHRGFAHLALRTPVEELAILPVALASTEEVQYAIAPLKLFSLFDPSEPLFDAWGWHNAIIYYRAHLSFGRPLWITSSQRQHYRGRRGSSLAKELTQTCYEEIAGLLRQGYC